LGEERLYALQATSNDPQGGYELQGKLEIPTDRWAIDGSVLITEAGEKYFIWSGWEGLTNTSQNIYIARMANPWSIASDRVCISRPEYEWEKQGYPHVNEGPQALTRNGRIFIIYSASGSWTDDYCLGQLTYLGGDPLDPASWRKEPATRPSSRLKTRTTSSTTPPAAAKPAGPARFGPKHSPGMRTVRLISGSRFK
jgi:GH43 family beta-xylosidase